MQLVAVCDDILLTPSPCLSLLAGATVAGDVGRWFVGRGTPEAWPLLRYNYRSRVWKVRSFFVFLIFCHDASLIPFPCSSFHTTVADAVAVVLIMAMEATKVNSV